MLDMETNNARITELYRTCMTNTFSPSGAAEPTTQPACRNNPNPPTPYPLSGLARPDEQTSPAALGLAALHAACHHAHRAIAPDQPMAPAPAAPPAALTAKPHCASLAIAGADHAAQGAAAAGVPPASHTTPQHVDREW